MSTLEEGVPTVEQFSDKEPMVQFMHELRDYIPKAEEGTTPVFPVAFMLGKNWQQKIGWENGKPHLSRPLASWEMQTTCAAGYALLRSGKAGQLIVTGGLMGDRQTEAREMSDLIQRMCETPEEWQAMKDRIILEDRSMSTRDNAKYMKRIVDELNENQTNDPMHVPIDIEDCLLVTVGFHLQRARNTFNKTLPIGHHVASENVFYRVSQPEGIPIIQEYLKKLSNNRLSYFVEVVCREFATRGLDKIDPNGHIIRWLAEKFREREPTNVRD